MSPLRRVLKAYRHHRSTWKEFRFVYPVVSRRARGISIGINLSPRQECNFGCVYCQVNRAHASRARRVNLRTMERELRALLGEWRSGRLLREEPFASAPRKLRRLRMIAFSGDGEPTAFARFDAAIRSAASVRQEFPGCPARLILITNASLLHRPAVRRGLAALEAAGGEVWAKLDAGTAAHYRRVNRCAIPFRRVLSNIRLAARERPVVIQSLFLKLRGRPPAAAEIAAYCRRLRGICTGGGRIRRVQIYTVAREPVEPWATPLSSDELVKIAALVGRRTGLKVECFTGHG